MALNPYRDWLAIDGAEQPTHYELLGIPLFADDRAAAASAYAERYASVRRYEVGNYSDQALALLEELSSAFKCLTDEQRKAEYDNRLRESIRSRETSVGEIERHETLIDRLQEVVELELAQDTGGKSPAVAGVEEVEWVEDDAFAEAGVNELDSANTTPVATLPKAYGTAWAAPSDANASHPERKQDWIVPAVIVVIGLGGVMFIGTVVMAMGFFFGGAEGQPIASRNSTDKRTPSVTGNETVSSNDPMEEGVVAWRGRVARILIDSSPGQPPTLHLLIHSDSRDFEAISTDPLVFQQVMPYFCLAEGEQFAQDVTAHGALTSQVTNYFDVSSESVQSGTSGLPVVQLAGLDAHYVLGAMSTALADVPTLRSLRTVDGYTRFEATVLAPFEPGANRLFVRAFGRRFAVEFPAALQAKWASAAANEPLTLVTRTTNRYAPASGSEEALILQAETVQQPDWREVLAQRTAYTDRELTYQGPVISTQVEDGMLRARMTLLHSGEGFLLNVAGPASPAAESWINQLDRGENVLMEFMLPPDVYQPARLLSLTRLDDASDRVEFEEVRPDTPPAGGSQPPVVSSSQTSSGSTLPDVVTLSALPAGVDLPSVSTEAVELLALRHVNTEGLALSLDSALINLKDEYRFVTKAPAKGEPRWPVLLQRVSLREVNQEVEVAAFTLTPEQLGFQWSEAATKYVAVEQLRNCVLRLHGEFETYQLALRSPATMDSTKLPGAKESYQIRIPLTHQPALGKMMLDVKVITNSSMVLSYFNGRASADDFSQLTTVKYSGIVDIPFSGQPGVELHLKSRLEESVLVVEATPRYRNKERRVVALTAKEVDDYRELIQKDIDKNARSIDKANDEILAAMNRINDTRAASVVQGKQRMVLGLRARAQELAQDLVIAGKLEMLASLIHTDVGLQLRVYAQDGATEVTLVSVE